MAITPITLDAIKFVDPPDILPVSIPTVEVEGALNRGGRHAIHFGEKSISGVTKNGTTPVSRKVQLLDVAAMTIVAETISAADGTYSFNNLPNTRQYCVVAYDPTFTYDPAARDNVTPE